MPAGELQSAARLSGDGHGHPFPILRPVRKVHVLQNLAGRATRQWHFGERPNELGPSYRGNTLSIPPSARNLGNAYLDVGEYAKSDNAVRRALAIAESGHYEDRFDLAYIMSSLGRGYVLRKQYLEAEATYGTVVSMFADTLGSQHPEYALALTNLALVYQRQGRFREALPLLESAKDILERSFGREAPILATTLYAYADVMKGLGRKSEAQQFARRAKSIVRPDAGTVDIRVLRQHDR